jgi:uncharacterized protein (DUF983 family)
VSAGAGRVSAPLAAWRGVRLRCPSCSGRTLFRAYLKLNAACPACGADFSRSETADVAPYVTTFIIGIVFMPPLVVLGLRASKDTPWFMPAVLAGIVAFALVLLPRVKGALAALLWRAGREM